MPTAATRRDAEAAGSALWRAIIHPDLPLTPCDDTALRGVVERLRAELSTITVSWLLGPHAARWPDLLPPAAAERDRQMIRFLRARARDALASIHAAGVPVVGLKGVATALRFYPDPALRSLSDMDLLVRAADLGRLCDALQAQGYVFRKSRNTPSWGLSSESSFHPLVSPDGHLWIDIHVAADDHPVGRALPVDDVFAAAGVLDLGGVALAVPCDDHLIFLAVTNAARDKFDDSSLRAMTDLIVALTRARLRPDWDRLIAMARRAGLTRQMRAAVMLLAWLGVDRDRLPAPLLAPYGALAGRAFDALAADFATVFATPPSLAVKQWRDWAVIASPGLMIRRNLRRIRGFVRPWTGLPPGRAFGETR